MTGMKHGERCFVDGVLACGSERHARAIAAAALREFGRGPVPDSETYRRDMRESGRGAQLR